MSLSWYALRSKPRKEDAVYRQALNQGFEAYFPRIRVQPVNPRSSKLRPYFPGYLFVRADLAKVGLSTFQWMPHTHGLVCFGGEPALVPENLVQAIRARVEEINQAGGEKFDAMKIGDRVKISAGPFEGYEAIFDGRVPGSVRVRVLLELLGSKRQVPVVMEAGLVSPKKRVR